MASLFSRKKKSDLNVCLSAGRARLGRAAGTERTAGRRNQRRQGARVHEKNTTVLLKPRRAHSKINPNWGGRGPAADRPAEREKRKEREERCLSRGGGEEITAPQTLFIGPCNVSYWFPMM